METNRDALVRVFHIPMCRRALHPPGGARAGDFCRGKSDLMRHGLMPNLQQLLLSDSGTVA